MRTAISAMMMGAMTATAFASDWRDAALDEIRNEASVVEATFPQNLSLWASMRDDGTRRDGFANYLCLILAEAGKPSGDLVIVHVWDAAKMAREEMVEIGRAECK